MTHFSATPAMTGSGDTIRFGSLEYPALSPMGMWVPLVFEPSQAFLFGSLDFVADRLDVLHLREETRDPAPVGETFSIDSETRDLNAAASALHSEQTLYSNPTVSNMCTFIRPLFTISHRSPGGTAPPTPQTSYSRFPYGLMSSVDAYAQGLRRVLAPSPLTSEFVGMAGLALVVSHELSDNEGESDGSSIGDVAPCHCPSWECAMVDGLGQPPVVVESVQTHTPLDPRAEALMSTQAHTKELRQRR